MSTWARLCVGAVVWFVVGIPVGMAVGKHLKRRRERYYPPVDRDERETS